jgi:chitinase
VNVFGDTTTEPNETFNVTLGTPAPTVGCNGTAFQGTAVGTKGTGTGTILNDDGVTPTTTPAPTTTPIPTITPTPTPTATPTPTPTPTPAPATLNISNGAPRPARPGTGCAFTITLTRAATGVVTVDFATADGTAHAGSFYSSTMGTLTFAPGETSKTVNVNVLKRARKKKNFFMNLSNPVGAPVADGNGVCTIDRRGH